MSRNAAARLCPEPLPPLSGGAELFIVESELEYPDPVGGTRTECERSLCVLVLITPGEEIRRQIRAEASRYVGARCFVQTIEGRGWAVAAGHAINQRMPAFTDIVIGLPQFSEEVQEQIEQLHSLLSGGGVHRLGVWAAVADHPSGWASLTCPLGFVKAIQTPSELCAIQLHAGLAQLGAPGLVECVSADDVGAALGTPLAPALCLIADLDGWDGLFDEIDLPTEQALMGPAVAFQTAELGLSGYRHAVRSMRSMGLVNLCVVASYGLTLPPLVSTRMPRLVLLIGPSDMDRQTKA